MNRNAMRLRWTLMVVVLSAGLCLPAQEIALPCSVRTLAGPSAGAAGDGGPASQSLLFYPMGITRDAEGNFFISDRGNLRIRKVAPDGTITTVAGHTGELVDPGAIAAAPSGAIYFLDGATRIRVLTSDGTIATVWEGTDLDSLAVSPAGEVYFTTLNGTRIYSLSSDGTARAVLDDPSWAYPSSVQFEGAGNLYFRHLFGVARIADSGEVERVLGTFESGITPSEGASPLDLRISPEYAVTQDGRMFFVYNNRLWAISDGKVHAYQPFFLERLGAVGNELFAYSRTTITRFVDIAANERLVFAGRPPGGISGDGGPAGSAELASMGTIAADPVSGTIYFLNGSRVRSIAPDGTISSVFVQNGPPNVGVAPVKAIAVDMHGNLFVFDGYTNSVLRRSPAGNVTTVLDRLSFPSAASLLQRSNGLAVDSAGMLYLRTPDGFLIRIDPSTNQFSLVWGNFFINGFINEVLSLHAGPEDEIYGWVGTGARAFVKSTRTSLTRFDFQSGVTALTTSPAGVVYFADFKSRIWRVSAGGRPELIAADSRVATEGEDGIASAESSIIYFCTAGLALDSKGDLLVSDRCRSRIRVLREVSSCPALTVASGEFR